MTRTGHCPGVPFRNRQIDFHHRLEHRVLAAVRGEGGDGRLQLLAVGRERLSDADLAAGRDEHDFVLAWQLVQKHVEARPESVWGLGDRVARTDDQGNPHWAIGPRRAQDLAADTILDQYKIGAGQIADWGAAAVPGADVQTRRWTRCAEIDGAAKRTATARTGSIARFTCASLAQLTPGQRNQAHGSRSTRARAAG